MINTITEYNVLNTPWPLEDNSVDCCITSPPYWGLRDYGIAGQLGLEKTPDEYVDKMVKIFDEAKRVLKPTGTLWLNLGDSYCASSTGNPTAKSTLQGGLATQIEASKRPDKSRIKGIKPKDLIGVPWMVAFALRSAGWYLRQDIIWHKPNPMPESVTDRCAKSHEYFFLLSKSARYYFDHEVIKEPMAASSHARLSQNITDQKGSDRVPGKTNGTMKAVRAKGNRRTFRGGGVYTGGKSFDNSALCENDSIGNVPNETGERNKRSVWTVATMPFTEAHFATFPEQLITPCVLAGCPKEGVILDPFMGAGTTAIVAKSHGRNYIGFELNPEYIRITENRLKKEFGMFHKTA